jgi:hypothetical protein
MVAEAVSKRRKKTPEPTSQIDELLIEIWEKRFADQDTQIGELTRSLRGHNGTPGVMERLASIETKLDQALRAAAPAATETKGLTKDQLASMLLEFLKPVATALIIWALLTFFPQVMVHILKP